MGIKELTSFDMESESSEDNDYKIVYDETRRNITQENIGKENSEIDDNILKNYILKQIFFYKLDPHYWIYQSKKS